MLESRVTKKHLKCQAATSFQETMGDLERNKCLHDALLVTERGAHRLGPSNDALGGVYLQEEMKPTSHDTFSAYILNLSIS